MKPAPTQALKDLSRNDKELEQIWIDNTIKALLDRMENSITDFKNLPIRFQFILVKKLQDITLTPPQQIHCLQAIAGIPFHKLSLIHYYTVLTDTLLIPILIGAHQHLLTLNLDYCQHLTKKAFIALAIFCPQLKNISAKAVPAAKEIYKFHKVGFPKLYGIEINPTKREEKRKWFPTAQAQSKLSDSSKTSYSDFCTQFPFFNAQFLTLLPNTQIKILTDGLQQRFSENNWTLDTLPVTVKEQWTPIFDGWITTLQLCQQDTLLTHLLKTMKKTSNKDKPDSIGYTYRYNDDIRKSIVPALRTLGIINATITPRLVKSFISAIEERNLWTSDIVDYAFKQFIIENPRVATLFVQPFLTTIQDETSTFQHTAIFLLRRFVIVNPDLASNVIGSLLTILTQEKDQDICDSIIIVLAKLIYLGPQFAKQFLEKLISITKSYQIENTIIEALKQVLITAPPLIPQLLKQFENNDAVFRKITVIVLKKLINKTPHPSSFLELLLLAIQDDTANVRKNAAKTLGKLVTANPSIAPQLIPPLLIAMRDKDSYVPKAAAVALEQLTTVSPQFTSNLVKSLIIIVQNKTLGNVERETAIKLLGNLTIVNPSLASQLIAPFVITMHDAELFNASNKVLHYFAFIKPQPAQGSLEPLLIAMKNKKSTIRRNAAQILGQFASKNSNLASQLTELFIMALQDEDHRFRKDAIDILEQIGTAIPSLTQQFIKPIATLLQDEDPFVQKNVAYALGKLALAEPKLIPQLEEHLLIAIQDKEVQDRHIISHLLGKLAFKTPQFASQFAKLLFIAIKDEEDYVQAIAIPSLEKLIIATPHLAPQCIGPIIIATQDKESWIRESAIKVLEQFAIVAPELAPQCLESLLTALQDKEMSIIKVAAHALGQFGATNPYFILQFIEPLLTIMQEKYRNRCNELYRPIRKAAAHALKQLATMSPQLALRLAKPLVLVIVLTAVRYQHDLEYVTSKAAIYAIAELIIDMPQLAPQFLKPLLTAVQNETLATYERTHTIEALEQLVTEVPQLAPQFLDPLLIAMQDEDRIVRDYAAQALGQLVKANPFFAEQLIKPLLTAIEDKSFFVQRNAAYAFGKLVSANPQHAPDILKHMLKILNKKQYTDDVKRGATLALGKIISALTATKLLTAFDTAIKHYQITSSDTITHEKPIETNYKHHGFLKPPYEMPPTEKQNSEKNNPEAIIKQYNKQYSKRLYRGILT